MCFFSKPPDIETPAGPPVRRPGGAIAQLFNRRRASAQGAFGNIFTSPLGAQGTAQTQSTSLANGTQAARLGA